MTSATDIPLKATSCFRRRAGDAEQVERALIDASTRVPVLMFYASAMVWLLIGTLLAGFVSFKLHSPDLVLERQLSDLGPDASGAHERDGLRLGVDGRHGNGDLVDGAIMPDNAATSAAARYRRLVLEYRRARSASSRILMGDSTGYQWLEFPPYAAAILFVAYALIISWAVLMFRFRRGEQIYITQWYLLGAFLWFPWLYAAAQAMLFVVPVQGVMQAAVGWWYANNLLFLWFGAIALGTAYYMIPKVIGRPVYSYHLATIGFWTYALFSSWTGMQRLVDGPFPAWMITASIAATILTIIPVATVGLNHHMTMQGYFPVMRYSPTLRFTVFGAMSYTVFSLVGVLISLRSTARYLDFTEASIAYSHIGLYAFFTMVMFGSMYYIVPRLVGREWRYATLIKLHFWASAYGIGLMSLMLLVGGLAQGASQNDPSLPFIESIQSVLPYLRGRGNRGSFAHGLAFHFRVSFRSDAVWAWPHFDRSDILESSRSGRNGGALMKGLLPLFLGMFGTFAFSWVGLTVIPNLQIGSLNPQIGRGRHRYLSDAAIRNGRARPAGLCRKWLHLLPQPTASTRLCFRGH